MGDLSKLVLPDGTELNIKDASAVQSIVVNGNTVTVTMRDGTISTFQLDRVIGIKGVSEADYRTGNVEITLSDLGLDNVVLHDEVSTIDSEIVNNYYTKAEIDLLLSQIRSSILTLSNDVQSFVSQITQLSNSNDLHSIQITDLQDNMIHAE